MDERRKTKPNKRDTRNRKCKYGFEPLTQREGCKCKCCWFSYTHADEYDIFFHYSSR